MEPHCAAFVFVLIDAGTGARVFFGKVMPWEATASSVRTMHCRGAGEGFRRTVRIRATNDLAQSYIVIGYAVSTRNQAKSS